MSDSDPYWAHADYSLFTYGEKTQLKKDSTWENPVIHLPAFWDSPT